MVQKCSIFPIGILSVLCRGFYLCNTYAKMFNFSSEKIPDKIASVNFLFLKFVYMKNFDYLCARKGLRKIKTIDEIGIN